MKWRRCLLRRLSGKGHQRRRRDRTMVLKENWKKMWLPFATYLRMTASLRRGKLSRSSKNLTPKHWHWLFGTNCWEPSWTILEEIICCSKPEMLMLGQRCSRKKMLWNPSEKATQEVHSASASSWEHYRTSSERGFWSFLMIMGSSMTKMSKKPSLEKKTLS